jgi:ATP/maltotriose-dependent transcriptional regulator MalT
MLLCTTDLDDCTDDALIRQALAIQPNPRPILMAEHNNFTEKEAKSRDSSVIIAAKEIGEEGRPWHNAMFSIITNTIFRSKSIASTPAETEQRQGPQLKQRDRKMLECFALGMSNAEAAEHLKLSPHSTKTSSIRLLAKLKVNNRELALLKVFGRLAAPRA